MDRRSFLKRASGLVAAVAAPLFIPSERLAFGVPRQRIITPEPVTLTLPQEHWGPPTATRGWAQIAADGTIGASFNVQSVTRQSTGVYTIAWQRDFVEPPVQVVRVAGPSQLRHWVSPTRGGSVVSIFDAHTGAPVDGDISLAVFAVGA